jgi:hypothetical protein
LISYSPPSRQLSTGHHHGAVALLDTSLSLPQHSSSDPGQSKEEKQKILPILQWLLLCLLAFSCLVSIASILGQHIVIILQEEVTWA